jgi:hypothetical protein
LPSVRTHEQRAVGDSFSQASRMANSKSARRVVGSSHGTSGEEAVNPVNGAAGPFGRWAATPRTARRLRLVTSVTRALRNGSNNVFAPGPIPDGGGKDFHADSSAAASKFGKR